MSKSRIIDLTNQKFDRLTVINFSHIDENRQSHWWVKCDCDNKSIHTVRGSQLRSGHTKSCGCLQKEVTIERQQKDNVYDLTGKYGIGYDFKDNSFEFDLEDYEKINNYCWHKNKRGYIVSSTSEDEEDKKQTIRIHRIIMGVNDPNIEVDHIDRNKCNNKKYNLRLVNRRQNEVNKNLTINNKSGCQGVYFNIKLNKWHSQIYFNKKKTHLGYYESIDDAIIARLKAEIEIENFNNNHLYEKYGFYAKIEKIVPVDF